MESEGIVYEKVKISEVLSSDATYIKLTVAKDSMEFFFDSSSKGIPLSYKKLF